MLRSLVTSCVSTALVFVSLSLLTRPGWSVETLLFDENFEILEEELMPAVLAEDGGEGIDPEILGWTHQPPPGWEIANLNPLTGVFLPGIDDPFEGVEEWEGWSFTTPEFWQAADGQRRDEFTLATGVLAVADPDEWDDLGDPEALGDRACGLCGPYNTLLVTPSIPLAGVDLSKMRIEFDSSWRPECDSSCQRAELLATYNDGTQVKLLDWTSDGAELNCNDADDGEFCFKDDNSTNDHLVLPLHGAPAGAESVSFIFEMLDAGNDWWWAIDNIDVYGDVVDTPQPDCDFDSDLDCDVADIDLLNQEIFAGTNGAAFDLTGDSLVDLADQDSWRAAAATENGFAEPYLKGDSNLDGTVNAVDLNAIGRNWQQAVALWSEGDFDASGFVDAGDLNLLGIEWQGTISAAASEAVPEPSGLALLLLGGLALVARRGAVNDSTRKASKTAHKTLPLGKVLLFVGTSPCHIL